MTSSAFWFCISTMYFPFISNDLIDNSAGIPDILQKILEKNINANKYISNKKKFKKKKILMDIISLIDTKIIKRNEELNFNYIDGNFNKKLYNIDNLITEYNENLNNIHKINKDRILTELIEKINQSKIKEAPLNLTNSCLNLGNVSDNSINNFNNIFSKILTDNNSENTTLKEYDPDDILLDLQFKSKHKNEFLQYIIRKHEEMSEKSHKEIILSRSDEEKNHNPDDIVCLVCNDGDYEDNNLIVYCSKCQMTVHQLCYGIVTIPEEDWLCYPCQFYEDEKAKDIECALCPIKGGAMKPSCLKIKSGYWNYVMGLRRKNYKSDYVNILNNSFTNGLPFNPAQSAPNFIMNIGSVPNTEKGFSNKYQNEFVIVNFEGSKSNLELDRNIEEIKDSQIYDFKTEIKAENKMNETNSQENSTLHNKLNNLKQESLMKNISNRTITESNDDYYSVNYFDQNPSLKENHGNENINEDEFKQSKSNGHKKSEKIYFLQNQNEKLESTFLEENLEGPVSTNDNYNSIIKNKNKLNLNDNDYGNIPQNKIKEISKNCDIDSYSFKEEEMIEKVNAEPFSNESINDKNINTKSKIDEYNLNLNENDILSLENNNFPLSLIESKKLEDEKSLSVNNTINTNRKRGRHRKRNIRNKKDDSKNKDNTNNQGKSNNELVSNISRRNFTENAWVHLSCALWIPEVHIEDFDKKENIKNIESIEKKRFIEKCSICGLSGYGPTLKCENTDCKTRFHVECARINKYQMEFIDNSNGEVYFKNVEFN